MLHRFAASAPLLFPIAAALAQGTPVPLGDLVTSLPTSYDYGRIVSAANAGAVTYFLADDGGTRQHLWKTDGTTAGTVRVKSIAGSYGTGAAEMVADDGIVFFTAHTDAHGHELWCSDGTEGGTWQLGISAAQLSSHPRRLTVQPGVATPRIYFSAVTLPAGRELWTSDGTTAGTTMVADVWPGASSGMVARRRAGRGSPTARSPARCSSRT